MLRRRLIAASLLLGMLLYFLGADSLAEKIWPRFGEPDFQVNAFKGCRPALTELGRRARFRGVALFHLEADAQGTPLLRPIHVPFSPFVDLESFESCVRLSTLKPEGQFLLSLEVGTTGETLRAWKLSICQQDGGDCQSLEWLPNKSRVSRQD